MNASLTWLLTSTTYGTWLPGDERGFVGRVTDLREDDLVAGLPAVRVQHDVPGSEYDKRIPGLRRASMELMKGEPVWLNTEQAVVVRDQFLETAKYRGWEIHAVSVMANHFHLVVTADEQVLSDYLLRDFKSYASRALNKRWPRPKSGTWWTASASRRMLHEEQAIQNAIRYVLNQHAPLAIYPAPDVVPRN